MLLMAYLFWQNDLYFSVFSLYLIGNILQFKGLKKLQLFTVFGLNRQRFADLNLKFIISISKCFVINALFYRVYLKNITVLT